MSDWFFMLGESLNESERRQAESYLRGLGIEDSIPVVDVSDWNAARTAIADPAWDRRWWDAEQAEKQRLQDRAKATVGEQALMLDLSQTVDSVAEAIHGAAAVEAARRGCSDAALIRAAAGSATEAYYLAALARLAGAGADHPFEMRQALFAGGHWPLGIVNGRYHIF